MQRVCKVVGRVARTLARVGGERKVSGVVWEDGGRSSWVPPVAITEPSSHADIWLWDASAETSVSLCE